MGKIEDTLDKVVEHLKKSSVEVNSTEFKKVVRKEFELVLKKLDDILDNQGDELENARDLENKVKDLVVEVENIKNILSHTRTDLKDQPEEIEKTLKNGLKEGQEQMTEAVIDAIEKKPKVYVSPSERNILVKAMRKIRRKGGR